MLLYKEAFRIVVIAFGLVLLSIYLFRSIRKKTPIQLEQCIIVFLTGPGIITGLALLTSAIYPPFLTILDDYQIYVGVAGITVIYVSIAGIGKYLKA